MVERLSRDISAFYQILTSNLKSVYVKNVYSSHWKANIKL